MAAMTTTARPRPVARFDASFVASCLAEYGTFSWLWFETGDTESYFAMFPWPPPSPVDLLIAGEAHWHEQETAEWSSRRIV